MKEHVKIKLIERSIPVSWVENTKTGVGAISAENIIIKSRKGSKINYLIAMLIEYNA